MQVLSGDNSVSPTSGDFMSDCCCSQTLVEIGLHELPQTISQDKPSLETVNCPQCHRKGMAVQGQTVKSLLSVSLRLVQDTAYYFCRTQSCPVVYYSTDGRFVFTTTQLRERVYQKEPGAEDVFVCYCFGYTTGQIRHASPEVRATIIHEITAGIQAHQCACDLRNPQGSCCLGNVRSLK